MASLKTRDVLPAIFIVLLIVSAACNGDKAPSVTVRPERAAVELSVQVDRAVAYPGDIITLTLRADYRMDVSMGVPDISSTLSEFRIVSSDSSAPVEKGDRFIAERLYKLQTDTAGSYIIAPIEVTYVSPTGEPETAKTPKLFIEVESLLGEEGEAEDIRDIKPPVSITSYRIFILILAILAGTVLIILLARHLFKRWRAKAKARKLAPRPAHEEALEALENLLKRRLLEEGHAREFCFEISDIFRRYMQARFSFPAIDLTTEEIIPQVESNGIVEEALRPVVREFLVNTDLVKFARHEPPREEMDTIIEHTRTFINRTAVVADPAAEDTASGEVD